MSPLENTLVLAVTFTIMFVGLLGTVLPVLPGTILILLGALFYAVVDGFQSVGWPTLAVLGLLTAVATTADIWVGGLGARAGGASGWSIVSGLLGGLIGLLFFSLPGAVIGAGTAAFRRPKHPAVANTKRTTPMIYSVFFILTLLCL